MQEAGLNTNEDKTPLYGRMWRKLMRIRMLAIPRNVVNARKLAVVIVTFNRSGRSLENALITLRHQTFPRSQVDMIICDWGSDAVHIAPLTEMCCRHGARLILVPPSPLPFNKSRAINVAIQLTLDDAEFVLQTDADMIFEHNFLEILVRAGIQFFPSLVLCSARAISQERAAGADVLDPRTDYEAIRSLSLPISGVGGCMCAPRAWWFRVRGYDERYVLWGHEDDDILKRAKLDGLSQVGIADRTSLIHQWHMPATAGAGNLTVQERRRREEALAANRTFYLESMSVVRNADGWGICPVGTRIVDAPSVVSLK